MTLRHLPIIALLFAVGNVQAKTIVTYPEARQSLSELKHNVTMTPHAAYYGSHARVHFYLNVLDIGYAHLKSKDSAGQTAAGGGLRIGGSLGVNIELGNEQSAYRNSMMSIGVALHAETLKMKSKDATGKETTKKLKLTLVSVPVSYTRLFYVAGEGAAFIQLGAVAGKVTAATLDDKPVTEYYNNFFIEPMVSVGASSLFRFVRRGSGDDMGGGRAFFCPYFGYILNSISSVPGTTTNGFDVGVKWIYSGW